MTPFSADVLEHGEHRRRGPSPAAPLLGFTSAVISRVPGSWYACAEAKTLDAFLASTRALYRRPEGSDEDLGQDFHGAAKSACDPAGMWKIRPTQADVADASQRDESLAVLGGLFRIGESSLRSGWGSTRKYLATTSRAFFSSNLPATTSTTLSGW